MNAGRQQLKAETRRWLILFVTILANTCMGAGYAFSVFKKNLIEVLQCTPPQVTLAYSLSFAFLPVGMLLGGMLSRRYSPQAAIAIGGSLFGLGVLLAGFAASVYHLYVTYGLMVSIGNGIVYAVAIAVAVRWFPDRKGLASGAVVAALGLGTLIIANVGQILVTRIGAQDTLKGLGASFLVIITLASRFIVEPPKGYAPAKLAGNKDSAKKTTNVDVTWKQMLAQPAFWVLFLMYICAASPGLMMISQAKDVAVDITKLNDVAAASMVGLLGGVASAVGRLGWAAVSDKMGRLNTLTAIMLISAVFMYFLGDLGQTAKGLWIAYLLVGLCYGGTLGTFPSVCADRFGTRNIEINYALLFVAFGAAALLGPWAAAQLKVISGSYSSGFMFSAALGGFGVALSLILRFGKSA